MVNYHIARQTGFQKGNRRPFEVLIKYPHPHIENVFLLMMKVLYIFLFPCGVWGSLPPTQYSIIFPSQKIRNSWEEDFLKVKRSTCSPLLAAPHSSRSSPQPSGDGGFEFLHPLHVQSGRAGMEVWGMGGFLTVLGTSLILASLVVWPRV